MMRTEGGRFLLATWDGSGNTFPVLALARELVSRGHVVRALGHQSQREWIEDIGVTFCGYSRAPELDLARPLPVPFDQEGGYVLENVFYARGFALDLLAELAREPADALLVDAALATALAGAEHSRLPTAVLFHTLVGVGVEGPFAEEINRPLPSLNDFRAELGLDRVASFLHQAARARLVLAMTSQLVDLPLPRFLDNVRYVGPLSDRPPGLATFSDPWPTDDQRPLVLVSFSTGFMDQVPALQRVLDALDGLPVRTLLTLGRSVEAASLRVPANTKVERFAPHDAILPRASLVVTHSGHGTVMRALAHGVPLVCLPMGRDQFFNAARVASLGLGRTVSVDASPPEIGQEILRVLHDPQYRKAAGDVAETIDRERDLATAVTLVEELLALPENPGRAW